jgi:hypothetical protein
MSAGAKAAAPKETGLLKLSLGTKVSTYAATNTVVGVVGPRKGFRRPIVRSKRGRLQQKKQAAAADVVLYRDPVKYAHLAESGRKAVAAKEKKTLVSASGEFLGRRVGPAPGRHFIRKASAVGRTEGLAIVARELAAGIEQEAARRA